MATEEPTRSPSAGKRQRAAEQKVPSDSETDTDMTITGLTPEELEKKMYKIKKSLEREIERRRDLQEDVDRHSRKISENKELGMASSKAIHSCFKIMEAEGEHTDNLKVLVIKKRGMTMGAFYAAFGQFQDHFPGNLQVASVSSTGPVWQIMTKAPIYTQGIRDATFTWCSQNSIQAATIRGKSTISGAKERICNGVADAIGKVFAIHREKGKERDRAEW
jgi:uncharacterized HAD superfamily protein